MKRAWRGKLTGLWLTITAIGLSMALAIPPADAAGRGDRGFLESFDRMAIHGYVDNFSILRNDTFKTDYHVASSRYRASVQLAGPLYMLQDYFDRFEYFIELRPQYESIYDIDDKFGNGRKGEGKRFVSGRSGHPSGGPPRAGNNQAIPGELSDLIQAIYARILAEGRWGRGQRRVHARSGPRLEVRSS